MKEALHSTPGKKNSQVLGQKRGENLGEGMGVVSIQLHVVY